jgi:hypothetical protein
LNVFKLSNKWFLSIDNHASALVDNRFLFVLQIRWEHVLQYSKDITSLLAGPKLAPNPIIEDPNEIVKVLFLNPLADCVELCGDLFCET